MAKSVAKNTKVVSDSSSSSSDSEVATKKQVKKTVKAPVSDSDSSDSSSSEEEKPVAKKAAVAAVKKAESSDSSDSDSSSEEEKPVAKKAVAKAESSDSSDSDSSSSEEEEKAPAPKRKRSDDDEVTDKRQKDFDGSANKSSANNTVFAGGLSYDATEDDIREFFAVAGEIESLRVPTFPDSGKIRGMAFVTYADNSSIEAALALNEKELLGRYVVVKQADDRPDARGNGKFDRNDRSAAARGDFSKFTKSEKPDNCKSIFIGGLAFHATTDDIKAHFQSCGVIASARVAWDREQDRSKGFAYVDFETEEAVEKAMKLTGTTIHNRYVRVDYATSSSGAGNGAAGNGAPRENKFGGDRKVGGKFGGDNKFGGDRKFGDRKFGGDRDSSYNKNRGGIVPGKNKVVSLRK